MSSNNDQSKELVKKRPSRTLKEIIESAKEGLPAPSEESRKVLFKGFRSLIAWSQSS